MQDTKKPSNTHTCATADTCTRAHPSAKITSNIGGTTVNLMTRATDYLNESVGGAVLRRGSLHHFVVSFKLGLHFCQRPLLAIEEHHLGVLSVWCYSLLACVRCRAQFCRDSSSRQ